MGLSEKTLLHQMCVRPGLTSKERYLINIVTLLGSRRFAELGEEMHAALWEGVRQEEIVAALNQVAFFSGWAAVAPGYDQLEIALGRRQAKNEEAAVP